MSKLKHDIKRLLAVEQPDCSYIDRNNEITWYNEAGAYHKEDGPAIIYPDGGGTWWLNGVNYTFKKWCIKVTISDEQKMLLRLQYA
jgi:hypothetical protein